VNQGADPTFVVGGPIYTFTFVSQKTLVEAKRRKLYIIYILFY